jgi:predicted metal-binding membrane protein
MRYGSGVIGLVTNSVAPRLRTAEARLASALAQPKRIAIGCVFVVSLFGWFALAVMAATDGSQWQALCRVGGVGEWRALALVAPMWAAMTLAMMLSSAGPMILTYAEIAETALQKSQSVASPLFLAGGYATVWLGFALAAAVLQLALARAGLLADGQLLRPLAGALFIAAGLYQFSALKHACLTHCQRPFPFFFANWTEEPGGVLQLGLWQGLYCLGCCAPTMLVMFAAGVMNIAWMALLGVVMTIEKLSTTPRFSRAVGGVMVAIGVALIAAAMA